MPSGSTAERLRSLPRLWFGFGEPVGRLEYAASGFLLTPLKFAVDSAIYRVGTGDPWPLSAYFDPVFQTRFRGLTDNEMWVAWLLALVTIPFLWIGVSMTVRRCRDARIPPAASLVFFLPFVNWAFMLYLCVERTRKHHPEVEHLTGRPSAVQSATTAGARTRLWLTSAGLGAALGLGMVLLSVALLGEYGNGLFIGSPFVMGAVAAFVFHRRAPATVLTLFVLTNVTLLAAALTLLLFALEGLVCLVMAYPLALGLGMLGAFLGGALGRFGDSGTSPAKMALFLPLLLVADTAAPPPELREVVTVVEIDAPPEVVWQHVVAFPDLAEPSALWKFSGIAYPTGATIDGEGVGAVRECEFSTGAFVEPVTVWDPPRLLAFDVEAQPAPMQELTPYDELYAPHLSGGLVSRRGEFRLIRLSDGRTRLEGRTWYTLDMQPAAYWTLWSDAAIHRIHRRVLEHVRRLAQRNEPFRAERDK